MSTPEGDGPDTAEVATRVDRSPSGMRRLVLVACSVFVGMILAFIMSTLMAGSAGASPLPSPTSPTPSTPLPIPTDPTGTPATTAADAALSAAAGGTAALAGSVGDLAGPVGPTTVVGTAAATAEQSLGAATTTADTVLTSPPASTAIGAVGGVVGTVAGQVDNVVDQVGPTAPALPSTIGPATPGTIGSGSGATAPLGVGGLGHSGVLDGWTGSAFGPLSVGVSAHRVLPGNAPAAPTPSPAPAYPGQRSPISPAGPGESLTSGQGNNPFGSPPPMSLLLPVLVIVAGLLGRDRVPHLLLDVRQSPPG